MLAREAENLKPGTLVTVRLDRAGYAAPFDAVVDGVAVTIGAYGGRRTSVQVRHYDDGRLVECEPRHLRRREVQP